MKSNNLNEEEAIAYIKRIEKEGKAYRKALLKDDSQNKYFDITINLSVFSDEEIVDIIDTVRKKRISFRI